MQGRTALETRVDYVESRLDEAISSLKEAIRDNKEAIQQLKSSFDIFIAKAESSRRWSIGLIITVSLAVIGFILTNGFQFGNFAGCRQKLILQS